MRLVSVSITPDNRRFLSNFENFVRRRGEEERVDDDCKHHRVSYVLPPQWKENQSQYGWTSDGEKTVLDESFALVCVVLV